jgi:hypothetical protein
MDPKNEVTRDRLLSHLPRPEDMGAYRAGVDAALAKRDKAFRREKRFTGALWIFCVLLSTVFVVFSGQHLDSAVGPWLQTFGIYVLITGALELLKLFINRSRVEVLKEVKQVQLQVLELHELLRNALPGKPVV